MFRNYNLSSGHYASKWTIPDDDNLYDREKINELAIKHARLPDGVEKEAISLQLIESFHGYLIKYTNMVIRGQFPNLKSNAGKDAALMLKTLVPKGRSADYSTLSDVCKTLHLGFKGLTTDEIYDVMVLSFLRACQKYNPDYTYKIRIICEQLDNKFKGKEFTVEEINATVNFESINYIRMLVKKQYLVGIVGPKRKIIRYKSGENWPPAKTFFESGPIGFVYFVQMWFRYYLSEYITKAMEQLETQQGVLQLDYRPSGEAAGGESRVASTSSIPDAHGAFTDHSGVSWSADVGLMNQQFDISQMDDDWVRETTDKLFKNLTRQERWILQMVFVKEFNWVQIASMLGCTTQTARQQYNDILKYLTGHVQKNFQAC